MYICKSKIFIGRVTVIIDELFIINTLDSILVEKGSMCVFGFFEKNWYILFIFIIINN